MKKLKVLAVLSLLFVSMFSLAGCGEKCEHSNLSYSEAPTRFTKGETYCPDCHEPDARIELPKLTDSSFYDIEVIDEDTAICTCEVLGKTFTFYSSNFEFECYLNLDGEYIYSVVGYKGSSKILNIPIEYNDGYNGLLPVKTIDFRDEYNGSGYSQVKEINIPSSIENIFSLRGMSSLEKLIIPETVTGFTDRILEGCNSIKSITFPNLEERGNPGDPDGYYRFAELFFGEEDGEGVNVPSSLKEVILTNETKIPDYAFKGCKYIESITFPKTITSIGAQAFNGCESLKEVEIPSSVTSIGEWAFADCKSLKTIVIPEGIKRIENVTFKNCTSLEKIVIPTSVKYIGDSSFDNCPLVNVYYEGSKYGWTDVEIKDYDNDDILNANVYFYAEEEPDIFEFIEANQSVWHYDEEGNPTLWDIKVEYTNVVDGKTFTYESSEIVITDEYWYYLEQSKEQGMLEYILDADHLNIYNSSTSKEDYHAKVLAYNQQTLAGQEIRFADGMVTVYDNGEQSTYPLPYYELNGELICYTNYDTIAYTIVGDYIYLDLSTEVNTVIHKYKIN